MILRSAAPRLNHRCSAGIESDTREDMVITMGDPFLAGELVNLGIRAHRGDDLDTARILLNRALVLDPVNERGWIWLARSLRTNGERRDCLERALKACPQNTTIREMLSEAHAAYMAGKAMQQLHSQATVAIVQPGMSTPSTDRWAFWLTFFSVVVIGLILFWNFGPGVSVALHWR